MFAAQLALNALALGAAYALVAIGFVLVLNATTAVNFGHGDTVVAGGFLAVALATLMPGELAVPGLVLLPAILALMALFGALMSWLVYLPIRDRPPVTTFITTIAFGIIIANGVNALFGGAPRSAPTLIGGGGFSAGELFLSRQSVAIVGVSAVLIAGLALLLNRTQLGRQLRACAQDPEMAQAVGIHLTRMTVITFALAAALAGAAGLLLANQFFVTPSDGGVLMLKAYIAVTIGGWGSLRGAVAGALLIAAFEVAVASQISQPVAEGLLYVTLFIVLFFRPQGLFGEPVGQRA
ncbi:MAG: branched-chain amino acid ABC transporter permease [Alphaproteobacteria bacterium]|nr:branched-chain amino acid ABC transporter permease [Alphaproteobacteria bacterium]